MYLIDEEEKLIHNCFFFNLITDEGSRRLFCAETPSWGLGRTLPLTKLQEKGFLEKNKLTIEVYMKVFEVVHQGKSTENDVLDYNGFNIIASQVSRMKFTLSYLNLTIPEWLAFSNNVCFFYFLLIKSLVGWSSKRYISLQENM